MITVSGPYGQYTAEAIVDPVATFTTVPAPALIELGIEPGRVVRLRQADGSLRFHQLGRALVTIEGQEDVMPVVFGEAGTPAVISAVALEVLVLRVDEESGRLVPGESYAASE